MKQRLLCGITLYCNKLTTGKRNWNQKDAPRLMWPYWQCWKVLSPEYLLTEKKKIYRVPSQNTSINRIPAQTIRKAVRSLDESISAQRVWKKCTSAYGEYPVRRRCKKKHKAPAVTMSVRTPHPSDIVPSVYKYKINHTARFQAVNKRKPGACGQRKYSVVGNWEEKMSFRRHNCELNYYDSTVKADQRIVSTNFRTIRKYAGCTRSET